MLLIGSRRFFFFFWIFCGMRCAQMLIILYQRMYIYFFSNEFIQCVICNNCTFSSYQDGGEKLLYIYKEDWKYLKHAFELIHERRNQNRPRCSHFTEYIELREYASACRHFQSSNDCPNNISVVFDQCYHRKRSTSKCIRSDRIHLTKSW